MSRVRVSIDRVVLQGVDPAERAAFVRQLERALARALSGASRPPATTGTLRIPVLKAGPIRLDTPGSQAHALGDGVARAISRGIRK